jgi:hypothetical protein
MGFFCVREEYPDRIVITLKNLLYLHGMLLAVFICIGVAASVYRDSLLFIAPLMLLPYMALAFYFWSETNGPLKEIKTAQKNRMKTTIKGAGIFGPTVFEILKQ